MNTTRVRTVLSFVIAMGFGVAIARADNTAPSAKPQAAAADNSPFAGAIEYAQKRTVKLIGAGAGREHGYASGIIVSEDGHILTAHGIYVTGDTNARLQIIMPDGRVYPATIERRSDAMQVVLLKIDAKTPEHFDLPTEPNVQKADWVLSVSNAFKVADRDEPLSVNMGIVSLRTEIDAKKRAQDVELEGDMLIIDAITSNPGAPGGALVTPDRKLAGMIGKIIESKSTNTRLNYAIPSDRLRQFVDGKDTPIVGVTPPASTGKAELGIRLFRLSGKRAPAYVDRVTTDSPAAKAGIQKDDLILAMAGEVVRSIKDFDDMLQQVRPGEEITVILKRKTEVLSVRLMPVAAVEE
ncbi:MAG: trypsin-like peptidase domain-containing protein [Phycisphaeraceae bacterium]